MDRRAAARRGIDRDLAAVAANDIAAQVETEARSLFAKSSGLGRRTLQRKHVRDRRARHADAVVANRDLHKARVFDGRRRKPYRTANFLEFDSV